VISPKSQDRSDDGDRLRALFEPHSVAIIGAVEEPNRLASTPLRLLAESYAGHIYPVSARLKEVGGLEAFRTVAGLPETPDVALVCVGSSRVPAAVAECAQAGVRACVVFASGFSEASEDGISAEADLRQLVRDSGILLLGPNSVGYRNYKPRVFASIAPPSASEADSRSVAVLGSSGGLVTYLASYPLRARGLSAGFLVDTGNEAGVELADCLRYVASRPDLTSVALVLETVRDGQKLAAEVENLVTSGRRVGFVKLGRSDAGKTAIKSHIGGLAGPYEACVARLTDAGAMACEDERQLLEYSVGIRGASRGNQTVVVCESGGLASLMADECMRQGIALPPLAIDFADPDWAWLRARLPFLGAGNPIDIGGSSYEDPALLPFLVSKLSKMPDVDYLVVWTHHSLMLPRMAETRLEGLRKAAASSETPIIVCGAATPQQIDLLRGTGIPVFELPSDAVRAIAAPSDGSFVRRGPMPLERAEEETRTLRPTESLDLLRSAGIPLAEYVDVEPGGAAAGIFLQFPVCVKINEAAVSHKADAGGVILDVHDERSLNDAIAALRSTFGAASHILVQSQVQNVDFELYAGLMRDDSYGWMMAFGWGGRAVEEIRDLAMIGLPAADGLIESRLSGTRAWLMLGRLNLRQAALATLTEFARLPHKLEALSLRRIEVNPFTLTRSSALGIAVDCHVEIAG
jgi:acyl-CoA synthetase (NDP forming)